MDLIKDRELFWLARAALKTPVPKPWKPCRMEDSDDIFYFNFETGESIWDHPCDLEFKQVYEKQIAERKAKEQAQGSRPRPEDEQHESRSAEQAPSAETAPEVAPNDAATEAPVAPQPKGSNTSSRARRFNVSFQPRR